MSNEARELIRRINGVLSTVPQVDIYHRNDKPHVALRMIDQILTMTERALDDQDAQMAKDLGADEWIGV